MSRIGSHLNLFVAHLHGNVEAPQVGDDADAEYLDAAMACHDNFRHGTHTHGVSTEEMVHAIFGWSFEGRSLHTDVYAVLDLDAFLLRNVVCKVAQLLVISLVHVREPWPRREVLAMKRMFGEEVDMVVYHHQIAYLELWVHATRGIAYKEGLYAQFVHHTFREGDLLHVVSLVEMKTAFHGHNILAAQLAEDEFAGMPLNRRYREVGNLAVWKFVAVSYF